MQNEQDWTQGDQLGGRKIVRVTPHHGGTNQNSGSENNKTLVMLIAT